MTVEPQAMTGMETTAAGSTELWLVDLARAAPALERQERETPRLGASDRAALAAPGPIEVRQQRWLAHLALRLVLERHLGRLVRGQDLVRPQGGKPRLGGRSAWLDFSLAHAGGQALIGVTRDGAIGVDLEEVRPVRIAQIRRRDILAAGAALIPSAPITQLSEEAAFMRAWVRLEALAKARGAGLARTLTALGLRQATPSDVSQVAAGVARHLDLAGLRLHDLALAPGRVGAVALDRTLALPPLSTFPIEAGGIAALLRTPVAG